MTDVREILVWLRFEAIPKLVVFSSMSFRVFVFTFRERFLSVEVIRTCFIQIRLAGSWPEIGRLHP